MGCVVNFEDYTALHRAGHIGINSTTRKGIAKVCQEFGWKDDRGWFERTFKRNDDTWFLDKIMASEEAFKFACGPANIDFWSSVEPATLTRTASSDGNTSTQGTDR